MSHQEKNSTLSKNNDSNKSDLEDNLIENISKNLTKLKIKEKPIRPTFYYNNDKTKNIRAGGILFYKTIDNLKYFLFIDNKYSNWIEDLGGKTDLQDKSIMNTIIREVDEETNNLIKKDKIYECLHKNSQKFYNEYSKYLLYVIEANDYISNLTTEDFGEKESHTGFTREILWIPQNEIKKFKLSPRLAIPELSKFFTNI